jgi:hypothetical protein
MERAGEERQGHAGIDGSCFAATRYDKPKFCATQWWRAVSAGQQLRAIGTAPELGPDTTFGQRGYNV